MRIVASTQPREPGADCDEIGIYGDLGARVVINARGPRTILGGSRLSPRVRAAMEAANRYHVDLAELLETSGQVIANLLGAAAARVTTGAAAALELGMAACMTGDDPDKMARLPDTSGMRNEFLLQVRQRFQYDHCPTVVGGRRVLVGDQHGTSLKQLQATIGPRTAAILYAAHLEGTEGTVSLADVMELGHAAGVPVLLDAAAQVYPIDLMKGYIAAGADIVCYSAKYFGGPNSTGIICGKADLIRAAARQDSMGYEHGGYRAFGRAMKLDRQEIVGLVVALKEWLALDHVARLRGYERQAQRIIEALRGVPGVHCTTQPQMPAAGLLVRVFLDPAQTGKTAREVASALSEDNPTVWLHELSDDNAIAIWLGMMLDADLDVLLSRLSHHLAQELA